MRFVDGSHFSGVSHRRGRIRVLHAPATVGGNASGLAEAERRLGLQSEAVTWLPNPFRYAGYGPEARAERGLVRLAARMLGVWWRASTRCDVLHLNFGRTVLDPGPNLLGRVPRWAGAQEMALALQATELGIYRLRRVPVFMTFQGDDARQGDASRSRFAVTIANNVGEGYYTSASDRVKRRRIELYRGRIEKIYFLNPDLGWVLPPEAEFLPYASVNPGQFQVVTPVCSQGVPHVVHAPSHRGVKGTDLILEALARLEREGVKFRLSLVEGKSFADARRIYETADVVIDQILAGWYGGLAVECMALGKPVVASIRKEDLCFIPSAMARDLPLIPAWPDTIYEVLREWLQKGEAALAEQGQRGRKFVETWHCPRKIAQRMKEDYLAGLRKMKGGEQEGSR